MLKSIITGIGAVGAGAGALGLFLLGYPGDLVPQSVLLVLGGITVTCGAVGGYLTGRLPILPPRDEEGKFKAS